MPVEHHKSPQLRQILQEYQQMSSVSPGRGYFDKGKGSFNQKSVSKLDSLFASRAVSGLSNPVVAQTENAVQFMIRRHMKKEYKQQQAAKHTQFVKKNSKKLPKPVMNEVS